MWLGLGFVVKVRVRVKVRRGLWCGSAIGVTTTQSIIPLSRSSRWGRRGHGKQIGGFPPLFHHHLSPTTPPCSFLASLSSSPQAKRAELLPTLDLMEAELTSSEYRRPFIAGGKFTIADATFTPYFALFGPAGEWGGGASVTPPALRVLLPSFWPRCVEKMRACPPPPTPPAPPPPLPPVRFPRRSRA